MRARSGVALAGIIAMASLTAGSASALTDRHAAPAATALVGWNKLSTGKVGIIDSIGLARFGSQLQAVWNEDVGSNAQLSTATVGANGSATMAAEHALPSSWATLDEYPVIFGDGTTREIAFSGIQDTNTSNPYSQGYQYLLTSADGHSWSLANSALTNSSTAYSSYGTDLVDPGGIPTVAYTSGSADQISYHTGVLNPIPATPSDDPTLQSTGPFAYNTGLGYDATTGQAWAVWYSNSGKQNTDGIDAQRVLPTVGGSAVHAPGSTNPDPSGSGYTSIQVDHRIAVAARVGGGLYAAYVEGYPTATRLALWQVGTNHVITVNPHGDVSAPGVAAGPGGRVWLYWAKQSNGTVEVLRSNPSVTTMGAPCTLSNSGQSTEVWDMLGNAAAGPLTLFADAGSPASIYDKVIKPCMGVSASPHVVHRGNGVTVHVTDAGAAVSGAAVHFAGMTKHTDGSGKASFKVPSNLSKGRKSIKVTKSGYQPASTHIRVK